MSLPVTVVCAVNHHLISFLSHAVCIFLSHFYLISQESSSSFFAILLYLPSGPTSSLIQRPRSPRWIVLGFTPPSSIPLSLPITLSHSSFPHSFSQRSVHCSLSQFPFTLTRRRGFRRRPLPIRRASIPLPSPRFSLKKFKNFSEDRVIIIVP